MLYTKTIEPGTFSLLKSLMGIPSLNNFSLVGGTALALRYGHRSSVDLDLFSHIKFDTAIIEKDFWDLYELLQHYSLQQIIDFHRKKYPGQMLAISIPNAISYFVDADESEAPVSFNNKTWKSIKKSIQLAVSNYLR